MDNRPFYELDDDEILIEEAAQAALSDAVVPKTGPATVTPALPLRSAMDRAQVKALTQRFAMKQMLTLLDHAYLINKLCCTLSIDLADAYGFAAAVRVETAMLMLDIGRAADRPRSEEAQLPIEGIDRLRTAALDYGNTMPVGLSLRFERDTLAHFANNIEGNDNFFVFRRFTLALTPTLMADPMLTDTIERYRMSAGILMSSAAAKRPFMPWGDVAALGDGHAEHDARHVMKALNDAEGVFES